MFYGKGLYSYATCALKNIKPAATFSPSDIISHSVINKAVLLNKKSNKEKKKQRYYQSEFSKGKNVNVYLEMDAESDESFGDIERQMSIPKGFPAKIELCAILRRSGIQD